MLQHHQRSLDIVPTGGIGNRLMAIFVAVAYMVMEEYDELCIRWAINNHCNTNIGNILTIKNLKYQVTEHKNYCINPLDLHKRPHTPWGFHFYETCPRKRINLPIDEIIRWISDNIHNYIEFVQYSPIVSADIGLHCRRCDWGASMDSRTIVNNLREDRIILDVEFERYVRQLIVGKSVFLATDSIRTEEYFKSHHQHIVISTKTKYPTNSHRDKIITLESLIDLHTLSASKTIIRDSDSTFSLVAMLMHKGFDHNGFITWPRPVLQTSGPGFGISIGLEKQA